jgi:hypothetical protein
MLTRSVASFAAVKSLDSNQSRQCSHFCRISKKVSEITTGSAMTSSRKTEKFRVNPFAEIFICTIALLAVIVVLPPAIFAAVDSTTVYARAFALLAAEPYIKQGFHVREDYWAGDLASGEKKAVRQQLFKGNEYWFWLGTEVDRAKESVHIYNSDGKLAEQPDSWTKGQLAAAHIVPKTTGSYFIIVSVEESPAPRTHWALVYGFR